MSEHFTDIHHHLLYGMDDGAKSQNRMYEMLRLAAEDGISRIIATPHMTPGVYAFDRAQYETALREAQEYSDAEDLGIEILPGAEILYSKFTGRLLRDGEVPTLAGTDRLLVEFSPDVKLETFLEALEEIRVSGCIPVVAHVERYECVEDNLKRVLHAKEEFEALFQMNCNTILQRMGFFENRFIRKLLKERRIDAIATDAHNVSSRRVHMKDAYASIARNYSESYAERLTHGALLQDDSI